MKSIKFFILYFSFILLINLVYSQELSYLSYTPNDGLSQSQVVSIYQDKGGFIWFGTKNGVSRFDGFNFKNYSVNDGLLSEVIQNIFEFNGKLFFSASSGVSMFAENKFYNFTYSETMLLLLSENTIGFDENNKITFPYIEKQLLKFAIYENGKIIPNSKINKLILDNENFNLKYQNYDIIYQKKYNCYYILIDNSIFVLKKNKLYKIFSSTSDKQLLINKGRDDEIYVYSDNKFYRIIDESLVLYRQKMNNLDVISFKVDKKGNIYQLLDSYEFLFAINNNIYKNNFTSQQIIFIDKEDNAWIGGENGFQKVFTKPFVNYNPSSNRALYDIWNISELNNEIYFFSFSQGLSKFNFKSIEKVKLPDFIKSNSFYMGNTAYKDGKMLVNTSKAGVCVFDGKNFSKLCSKIKFNYTSLYTYYDREKDIVLSGTNEGLIKFIKNDYSIYKMPFGENINQKYKVVSIIKDSLDRYWLGGFKKISILQNDSIIVLPSKNLKFDMGAITMCVDYKGNIWIGNLNGVFLYDYKSFRKIDIHNVNSFVGFITPIEKNRLLIGSMNYLTVFYLDNFYITGIPKIKQYERNTGFLASECAQNGAMVDSKGNIWIAGIDRVVMMEQASIKINHQIPATYFKEISYINSKMEKITLSENSSNYYKLSNDKKNIRIDFGATSTTAHKRVKFKYMLEGYDLTWSELTNEQFAVYTNLPPNKYTFKVKACNEDELWNQNPSEVIIMITPAFWQTWWFKISIIILILSIIFFTSYQILKNKKRKLQKKYESEKMIKELQLKSLKGQIDPHFTFNAINAISSLIYKEERKLAYHYFAKFAQLVRKVLLSSNNITRSIHDEINFIEIYLEIEKFRFKDKFDYFIEVAKDVDTNIQIPQMLIQTYVENSIKHGLMHLSKNGVLKVEVKSDNKNLIISVTDNGIGREKAAKISSIGAGLGISIMNQFYELYNSVNSHKIICNFTDLYDSNGNATGTQVVINFPKNYKYTM